MTDERIVAELCAAPADVLRQAAMLGEHLAAGRAIANPAGWLIEAVRAHYRHMENESEGMAGATLHQDQPVARSTTLPGRASSSHQAQWVGTNGEEDAGTHGAVERNIWDTVKGELRETTTAANFQRWFAPTVLVQSADDALVVGVPGERERAWLEHRLRGTVERAATTVLGRNLAISFVAVSSLGSPNNKLGE